MEIIKFLGMGREGCVFKVMENRKEYIVKYFKNSISEFIPICKVLDKYDGFVKFEEIEDGFIKYKYEKLEMLPRNYEAFEAMLDIIYVLYKEQKIGYIDVDYTRHNFLRTKDGQVFCVDYFNSFVDFNQINEHVFSLSLINGFLQWFYPKKSIDTKFIWFALKKKKWLPFIIFKLFFALCYSKATPLLLTRKPDDIYLCIKELIKRK